MRSNEFECSYSVSDCGHRTILDGILVEIMLGCFHFIYQFLGNAKIGFGYFLDFPGFSRFRIF